MDVRGASAIVTGGASGIGASAARALAELGVRCTIVDRSADAGKRIADELGGLFSEADVADEADIIKAVEAASTLGPLRVLVNAAGIGNAARTVGRDGEPHSYRLYEKVLRVNLFGTFNCIRLAAATMARTIPCDSDGQRGCIINIASAAAFDGQIGQAAYSASKAGVVGMTLPIARDLAAVGIRVNTIAPGFVDTPIFGVGERSQSLKDHLGAQVLFPKRAATADEISALIIHLVTNDYMNAETIRIDGGIRMPPK